MAQGMELRALLTEYVKLRNKKAEIDERFSFVSGKIKTILENHKISGVEFRENKQGHKITSVEPTRVKIDEEGLRKVLTPEQFSVISKVDATKLAAAIDDGVIPEEVAGQYIDLTPINSYIRHNVSDEYQKYTVLYKEEDE